MTVTRALLALLLLAATASAQEPLNAIQDRGYVAHWLVCGPFAPDGEGGIAGGIQRGAGPLTDTDYMKPVGGVTAVRPQHLMKVATAKGAAVWQQAGAQSETLDLAPFFPGAAEGIAYAAFYTQATAPGPAYIDLQTPLGARVWVNGAPVRDVHLAPVMAAGVDRFLVSFKGGANLVIIEIPGADIAHLADMAVVSEPEFKNRGFQNRPLLHGASGYEFGMRILPARMLGSLAFVPKLRSTGAFSGEGSQAGQDVSLTLFNPARTASPSVGVTARIPGGGEPIRRVIGPIQPETEAETILTIPMSAAQSGQPLNVEVALDAGDQKGGFTSAVTFGKAPQGGTVYVVTGARFDAGSREDQRDRTERRNTELARQVSLLDKEKDYGFDLGAAEDWAPFWNANPGLRETLGRAVARGRCAANAGYGEPDERIAGGELLARNLIYGSLAARSALGDSGGCYFLWNAPGMSSQTPQLLSLASIPGIVSDLKLPGIPELSWRLAPNGARVVHRHKQDAPGFRSVGELRDAAGLQRRELLERGLSTDILVNESALTPPEPFFLGACSTLARSAPAIKVSGNGGREFLNAALEQIKRGSTDVPFCGRSLMTYQPGDLVSQTQLKQTFARAETSALVAERLATLAALLGATYPEATLDTTWRQLLFSSTPTRLGYSETPRNFLDSLAASREALTLTDGVRDRATRYLATQLDTYGGAPSKAQGAFAIVVFNPSGCTRSEACAVEVSVKSLTGLNLLDDSGQPQSYWADSVRPGVARLNFIARDIPSLGYRSYFAAPGKSFPVVSTGDGAQIENEFYAVVADAHRGGAIVSIKDKKSGEELVDGLMNDIVAIDEDSAKNNHGHDLWTSGAPKRASAQTAKITVAKTAIQQRMTITAPFQDGTLVREVIVSAGSPRIDCSTRFDGVNRKGMLYMASLGTCAEGCAPVLGDRFGATVWKKGRTPFDYRTEAGKNPSGSALSPALGWFAASPNDYLRIGMDVAFPLRPTAVIVGDDPSLLRAGRDIQTAVVARGIPCSVVPDVPRKLNTVWTDSTEMPNLSDDLDHGAAMRIVLGNPAQNLLCKNLCRQLDGDTLVKFNERMSKGAMLLFNDKEVPKGYPPTLTLIVAGETTTQTTALATTLHEALVAGGAVQIPEESLAISKGHPQPTRGMAVFFEGSMAAGLEPDNTMALALFHGTTWSEKSEEIPAALSPEATTYRYALYPFAGEWRTAGIPRLAQAYSEPLHAVAVPLRLGQIPARGSLLDVRDPNFLVTTVKPGSYRAIAHGAQELMPSSGITVRGYESIGQRWEGSIAFPGGIRSLNQTDLLDRTIDSLGYTDKSVAFACDGFAIETLAALPSVFGARGPKASLDAPPAEAPNVFTRYWRHNTGAAPMGSLKLSVALSGNLAAPDATADLLIANNQTDSPVRGVVVLTAATGWNLAPAQVEYDLKPGEVRRQQISVLRDANADENGGIIARTDVDGRSYWDVLEQGSSPPTLEVSRNRNEVKATIKNPGSLPAIGYLDVIAPDDFGGDRSVGVPVDFAPRRVAVSVAPFQEQQAAFQITSATPPRWIVLRLAANGHVVYRPVEARRAE